MSKAGTLARIEKYKKWGKTEMAKKEQAFYDKYWGKREPTPTPEAPKTTSKRAKK